MSDDEEQQNDLEALGEAVDIATFEQILEMDDGDDREFSTSIVFGFFEQAEETFTRMDDALEAGDLPELSSLGHFLKGSAATIGLTLVKNSCEKIQNCGNMLDEAGLQSVTDEKLCLSRCKDAIKTAKKDYAEAEKRLKRFFNTD